MHSKLAGHLPLQDLIASTLNSARTKLAAAEESEKKKVNPFAKKNEEKGESKKEEKEEHEDEKEKKSSALDPFNPGDIEKLASALEEIGENFLKEADSIENGGESHQGGEQIPTNSPVGGKQPYKKDGSKKHQIPTSTGMEARKETGPAATAVPDTLHTPPVPLKSAYPAKGVLKTGAARLQAAVEKQAAAKTAMSENAAQMGKMVGASLLGHGTAGAVGHHYGKKQAERGEEHSFGVPQAAATLLVPGGAAYQVGRAIAHHGAKKAKAGAPVAKAKESSAVDFILSKISESATGGMTLDSKSGVGPKPESGAAGGNDARSALESSSAAINMKKVDGKKPQKRMLSEVLTEPALTSSTDSKVNENLRNASKGGVKIAAARAYLAKVAADESDPKHEALKKAIAKKQEEKGEKKDEEKSEEKSS